MAQTEQRWAYKVHGLSNSRALEHKSCFKSKSHATIIMIGGGEF